MTRIVNNYLSWHLGNTEYRSIVLVKIPDFDDPVYAHTGIGRYTFDGNVYESLGGLGSISQVEENGKVDPTRLKLILSGLPYDTEDRNSYIINEQYQNKEVTIYYMILDDNNEIVANAAAFTWVGFTGNANIKYGKTATVELEVTDEFAMWNKAQSWRYNNETQQRLYPSDTGLQYIFDATEGTSWRGVSN